MVERNLIREGFIRNTSDGVTFSGSQLLNEQQMTDLADGNTSVVAVTVSATENINVTADLGARWKLNRIELYTDDPAASNITMQISDNDVEYYEVTMTGSPNLYVGDILDSTVSGTPRYVRYDHAAASALDVFEWKAISDDTIVDFGPTGDDTEVEIADAPIGRPSDSITPLQLFNRYHKPGTAFVFIDNTGTDADELFEIATTATGPWFGRGVQLSIQPDNTPLSSGVFNGTQAVTASGYYVDFTEIEFDGFAWTGDNGATAAQLVTGLRIDSQGSTAPRAANFGLYTGITNDDLGGDDDIGGNFKYSLNRRSIAFRSQFYDRVRVRMQGPQLDPDDIVEGPRLYWRAADGPDNTTWPTTHSALPINPGIGFTEDEQDFIFDVGSVPTWSGSIVIRGMAIQPYTTVTGISNTLTDIKEIQVYNSSGQEMIALDYIPTVSGVKPHLTDQNTSGQFFRDAVLAMGTRIQQPCIITKVTYVCTNPFSGNFTGAFLARLNEGEANYSFPDRDTNNFTCKNVVRGRIDNGDAGSTFSWFVRWRAEPGDFLGFSQENFNGGIYYRNTSAAGYASAWITPTNFNTVSLTSASVCEGDLNDIVTNPGAPWERQDNVEVSLWPETVSLGDFLATGTYETPVFDAGTLPGLLSASFVAIEEGGSSVDSLVSEAFKTIRARASDVPPKSNPSLGLATYITSQGKDGHPTYPAYLDPIYRPAGFTNSTMGPVVTLPRWLNEEFSTAPGGSSWVCNFGNGVVTSLYNQTSNTYHNYGVGMMYHERDDELWVINVLISGTDTNDLRPIWDVYDPVDFTYKRTEHVKGQITYTYLSPESNRETQFEPAGFIYDASQEEIYIINRENYFYIGTATYYAVVTDLDGNFKRLSFRADTMGAPSDNYWENVVDASFDGTYFYFLTDDTNGANPSQGSHLLVARRGDEDLNDPTSITTVGTTNIDNIPGFETVANNPDGQAIVYVNGLLYILYAEPINSSDSTTFRDHELYAIKITFDSDGLVDEYSKVELVDQFGLSSTGGVRIRALDVRRDGFYNQGNVGTYDENTTLYIRRGAQHDPGMIYDPIRDQFTVLQIRIAHWGEEYDPRINDRPANTHIFDDKSHNFMMSFGADQIKTYGETPSVPQLDDPIWGALSGTLAYDTKQADSVLFPTGRYGQLQYRLNAGTGQAVTPLLIKSQLDQGIRVGDIPASGTTSIYLRTNIPDDQPLGDLQGRLKVFWELPE